MKMTLDIPDNINLVTMTLVEACYPETRAFVHAFKPADGGLLKVEEGENRVLHARILVPDAGGSNGRNM